MSCGTKKCSVKTCRCACKWNCNCVIPRAKKIYPAFGSTAKRDAQIGLHPKMYRGLAVSPAVGLYHPKFSFKYPSVRYISRIFVNLFVNKNRLKVCRKCNFSSCFFKNQLEEADGDERILIDHGWKIRGKSEGAKGTVENGSWSGNPRDPSMAGRRAAKTLQDNEKKRWIWRNCSSFPTFLAVPHSRTRRMIQQINLLPLRRPTSINFQ